MSSMSALAPGARLRMRSLQLRLNVEDPRLSDLDCVLWDDSCLSDLQWWSDVAHLQAGHPLDVPPSALFLFTDASDSGWGASLAGNHLSGSWFPLCSSLSINHRELLAVIFAVRGFLPLLEGQLVALYANTTTTLSYLKEGGTHSSTLNAIAQVILQLCEVSDVRLLPQFILGQLNILNINILADSFSRGPRLRGTLCHQGFWEVLSLWPATIDLLPQLSIIVSWSTFLRLWILRWRGQIR